MADSTGNRPDVPGAGHDRRINVNAPTLAISVQVARFPFDAIDNLWHQ